MQELRLELSIIKEQEFKKRYPLRLAINQRKLLQIYELFEKYQIQNTAFPFQNVLTQILYYFRRFTIVAAFILFEDKFAQWAVYFLTCFAVLTRNLEFRPYKSKKLQILHFFNEIILIIIVIFLPAFEVDQDDNKRFILGWVVNGLVLFDIAFQIVFIFIYLMKKLLNRCRNKKLKKHSIDTSHNFLPANQTSNITQNDISGIFVQQKKEKQPTQENSVGELFITKKGARRKKQKKDQSSNLNQLNNLNFNDISETKDQKLLSIRPNVIASSNRQTRRKRISSKDISSIKRNFKQEQDNQSENTSDIKYKSQTDQSAPTNDINNNDLNDSQIVQQNSSNNLRGQSQRVDIDELDDISAYDFGYDAKKKLKQQQINK